MMPSYLNSALQRLHYHFAHLKDVKQSVKDVVRKASVAVMVKPGRDRHGTTDCPICGKRKALNFCESGSDSSIAACCSTDRCVLLMFLPGGIGVRPREPRRRVEAAVRGESRLRSLGAFAAKDLAQQQTAIRTG